MRKFNFSYDEEHDDLFLYDPQAKSKGGVELGDVVLDLNAQKEVVGLQFLHASRLIHDLIDSKTSTSIKKILCTLDSCRVDIKTKNNLLVIKISLITKDDQIRPILSLPRIVQKSPALAPA